MSTNNIQDLFSSAQQDGLSDAAAGILVNNLDGTVIMGAQGVDVEDLSGDEVTLYVRVIDKSGSMSDEQDVVISVSNDQVDALLGSKASDSIIMSTWFFDSKPALLHSYLGLNDVVRLDRRNYNPSGLTALYDTVLDAMTSAVAYVQSLRDAGIRVRIVIVVITDGEETVTPDSQHRMKEQQIATVATDLLNQEIYTLALVGFGVNGKALAAKIGFPQSNVLDETSDPSGIRRAFGEVSKSVIRTSQTVITQNNSQNFFS